jgi:hypothetical protein
VKEERNCFQVQGKITTKWEEQRLHVRNFGIAGWNFVEESYILSLHGWDQSFIVNLYAGLSPALHALFNARMHET